MTDASLGPEQCSVMRQEGGCRKCQKNVQDRLRDVAVVTLSRCGHGASFAPDGEQTRVVR